MSNEQSWSRRKPRVTGLFWFRETPNDNAVSIEVFYQGASLYAIPPTHTLPVPLSEFSGEWCEILSGPPR